MENMRQLNMQTKELQSGHALMENPLASMNLTDDFLFDVATVDLETCKIIIELSLGIRLKKIAWKEGQKVIHNLPGKRGIRMDFYVEDIEGRVFDVEMQKKNEGNIPKRTRYYQALIDAPMLKSGERGFDNLKAAYIIVICSFDLFGYGKYKYSFDNRCEEIPELTLGDECRKIILNTKGKNDKEVDRSLIDFLHYVENSSEESVPSDCDERLRNLHKKVSEIKTNEQMGVSYMKMEERDRLIREEGEIKAVVSIVRRIIDKGEEIEKVVKELGISGDYVEKAIIALEKYKDKTDLEIAEMILYNEI